MVLALYALTRSSSVAYDILGVSMVCLWALRIGGFLLYRVLQSGSDRRFDGMREHFLQFGKFWLGQALTVWVVMLPATLAFSKAETGHKLAVIGIALWCTGFIIESIADFQKYHFAHDPKHKGHWIDSGIWRYSRHPNYFGEIMVWISIYIYAFTALTATERLIGLVSPLFITLLLLFVSGIPILERSADKRWGSVSAYQTYKQHTSILIPLPKNKS